MNKSKGINLIAFLMCIILIISVGVNTYTVHGENSVISTDRGTMTTSMDEQYIYISYQGSWDYNINETINVSVNGAAVSGANSAIVLNSGNNTEAQTLQVRNAWYQEVPGAEGKAVNSGYSNGTYETVTWEIKVPVSTYGTDISSVGLTWSNQTVNLQSDNAETDTTEETTGAATEDDKSEGTTEAATEDDKSEGTTEAATEDGKSEETTEAATTDADAEGGSGEATPGDASGTEAEGDSGNDGGIHVTSSLVVDGYYADWEGYPVTDITYTSNNAQSVHKGQIYTDGERVYVHFALNDLYTSQIQVQQMSITINGETHSIGIYPVNPDGSIDWNFFNSQMNSLPNGIHTNFGLIVDYTKYCDSEAAITIYDSTHSPDTKGDEIEFSFSLEDFGRVTGMKTDNVSSITVVNPNIGGQGISWEGTSTAPWLGALIAALLAGAGILAYKGRREKKREDAK